MMQPGFTEEASKLKSTALAVVSIAFAVVFLFICIEVLIKTFGVALGIGVFIVFVLGTVLLLNIAYKDS